MINDLVFVSPESEGVSSSGILRFINFIEENKINLHSFLIARHGNIIAEGYFPFFDENYIHRIYSAGKTYIGLAMGMLITEGKVSVDARVLDYLPELDTDEVPEFMKRCTVFDALMMSTPYYGTKPAEVPSLPENRFSIPCQKPAGSIFHYGDGTEICIAVIERVSGMYTVDYLRPLLDRLGVGKETYCLKNYNGNAWGASGMMTTMRDFAKVAEFVAHKGEHRGEQLIDRDYMELMTSVRIANVADNYYSELRNSGYGFQTWITPRAICLNGMGSQLAFYFKKEDLLFTCMGDTSADFDPSAVRIYDAVKLTIVDGVGEPIPEGEDYGRLKEKLGSLHLPYYGAPHSSYEKLVSGVKFTLSPNDMKWTDLRFDIGESEGVLTYHNARGEKKIRFGVGEYLATTFPETHYYDTQRGVPSGRELKCLANLEWIEEDKMMLHIHITDVSYGSIFAVISFKHEPAALRLWSHGEFTLEDYRGNALCYKDENVN